MLCWNCSGRAILRLNVRLEENERWLTILKNLKGILLFEFLQIAHWMRQRFQLVSVEIEPIKESNENWNKLIKCQIERCTRSGWSAGLYNWARWSAGYCRARAYQKKRWESKVSDKSNVVLGQVGQLANILRYGAQLVAVENESMKESWETSRELSQQKSSLWAWPGLLRLRGRLQILPIRLPLALVPLQHRHGLSERSAKEEKRDAVSKPSQTVTISSSPNQPVAFRPTFLDSIRLSGNPKKSSFSPASLMGWWVIVGEAKLKVYTDCT